MKDHDSKVIIVKATNKRKKVILIAITVFIIIVIGVPLFIDWIIIGNSFPSNIDNSDWVDFLGGYIGTVLGGCISLIGIYWTINFTREENRADREMSIRPAFDIYAHHLSEVKENWLGYILATIQDGNMEDYYSSGTVFLRIKNVGVGPALNIDFRTSIQGVDCDYSVFFRNNNEKVTTNALMSGEQAEVTIEILNCKKAPKKQEFQLKNRDHDVNELIKVLPSNFQLDIELIYEDLLSNWFVQKMSFKAYYMIKTNDTDNTKISCDINMIEIGEVQKYKANPKK